MKAKFIFEKFEEDTDPIRDMGIGIERSIDFKSKKELTKWVLKHVEYILHVKKIPEDIILDDRHYLKQKYTVLIQKYAHKYFTVNGNNAWPSDVYPNWGNMREVFLEKGFKSLDDYETYLNEKFTDETNPIHDMGIGVIGIREFKTVKEAAKMFVDNINILTNGVIKSAKDLEKLFGKVDTGTRNTSEPSPLAECKKYLDGINFNKPSISIHDLGGRFDRITEKILFLKNFKNAVRDYVYIGRFKEMNEKFTQDSDPVKDMGIGIGAIKKVFVKELNAFKKATKKNKYDSFITRGINDGIDILEGTIFEIENKFPISKAIKLLNGEIKNWHNSIRYVGIDSTRGVINGLNNVRAFVEEFKNQFNLK